MTRAAGADAPPLKIGFVATLSGAFTQSGKAADAAIAAFFKEHGDTVAGRKVVIIKRDDGGNAPENARRLAQELVVSEQVDFLMGIVYSTNALAVGDVSTKAKKPTFITNAAANGILEPNPYMARFSYTLGELTTPLAQWALKNNIKTAYIICLDYSAGLDAASGFQSAFTGGGAKILATGDLTSETMLPSLADTALGAITAMNYSATHNSALNRQLARDMHAADNSIDAPDFASVATYDALQAIYKTVEAQKGNVEPDKTMQLVRGLKFESPRGPIEIDARTRDIVQNIYIRRVEKVDGKYQNTEIATYPQVHDPLEK